jgi:hypothetical protein
MSAELVRRYFEEKNLTSLVTLFEALTEQRDRSELLTRSYLHQIKLLSEKFQAITEPKTGRPVTERVERGERRDATEPRSTKPFAKPAAKPTVEAMEL